MRWKSMVCRWVNATTPRDINQSRLIGPYMLMMPAGILVCHGLVDALMSGEFGLIEPISSDRGSILLSAVMPVVLLSLALTLFCLPLRISKYLHYPIAATSPTLNAVCCVAAQDVDITGQIMNIVPVLYAAHSLRRQGAIGVYFITVATHGAMMFFLPPGLTNVFDWSTFTMVSGTVCMVIILARDAQDRERKLLSELAQTDSLTQLGNRQAFTTALDEAGREPSLSAGVLLIDVDHFKPINDRYGHPFGDCVLHHVANALLDAVGTSGDVYRLGGDEFAIIVRPTTISQCASLAGNILRHPALSIPAPSESPNAAEGAVLVTLSIGIAVWPETSASVAELYATADEGLYAAKHAGRNGFSFAPMAGGGTSTLPEVRSSGSSQTHPESEGLVT